MGLKGKRLRHVATLSDRDISKIAEFLSPIAKIMASLFTVIGSVGLGMTFYKYLIAKVILVKAGMTSGLIFCSGALFIVSNMRRERQQEKVDVLEQSSPKEASCLSTKLQAALASTEPEHPRLEGAASKRRELN